MKKNKNQNFDFMATPACVTSIIAIGILCEAGEVPSGYPCDGITTASWVICAVLDAVVQISERGAVRYCVHVVADAIVPWKGDPFTFHEFFHEVKGVGVDSIIPYF